MPSHFSNARNILFYCFLFLQPLVSHSLDAKTCVKNIHDINLAWGSPSFPLKWKETSMSDGKPLVVTILEKNDSIFLTFVKEKEGLWAESTGLICQVGNDLEIEFTGNQIRFGPAANWVLKLAIGNGGKFSLRRTGNEGLQIKTSGWEGLFSSN
jgi:hypothetical protein